MRISASPVAILLLFAVLSCKKDGSSAFTLDAPAVYKEISKTRLAFTRLFALSGEIQNGPIIQRFEDQDKDILNSMSNGIFPLAGVADSFKVRDSENVDVYENFTYSSYKMAGRGSNATLTAVDTTTGNSYQEVYTRTIFYAIRHNKPLVYDEYLVSSTRGFYSFGYTTQKQFHLQKEKDGFQLPWVVAVVHYADGSTNYIAVQDKLNVNFHKNLASGDTVAVREYAVSYKK